VDGLVSLAFVLGSIAQFVAAALLIVVLWYLIGILRNIRDITDRMRRGSELLADDLFEFRLAVREESTAFWSGFKAFVTHLPRAFGFGKKKAGRTKPEEASADPSDIS
jgi:hypothetical protein